MARRSEFKSLYKAFDEFLTQCIRQDYSLFWAEDRVWTRSNVEEMKRRLVDSPIMEKGRAFEDKLQEQMSGAKPVLWKMIADMYYVYFLPSSFMKLEKKQSDIAWAAQRGGFNAPPIESDLWKAQEAGYTRTSRKYHAKYAQFWLIVLFAYRVKQADDPNAYLSSPQAMQSMLDEILDQIPEKTDRAYDMRHVFLYLAFPNQYERIISTRDKERIESTYSSLLESKELIDLDEALLVIREKLPRQRDDLEEDFDFYIDLRDEWRPRKRPEKVKEQDVEAVRPGISDKKGRYKLEGKEILEEILAVFAQTKNVILYGPPGTGKTYFAKKVAEVLAKPRSGEGISKAVRYQQISENLTFHEILALAMSLNRNVARYSVPELKELSLVKARFSIAPVKHPKNQIWGYLQSHSPPESETVKIARRAEPFLFDKDEESQWFLTEIGKDYVQENLTEELKLLTFEAEGRAKPEEFIEWVTFHQSYSYEEFIEGLRPVPSDEDPNQVKYEIVPGVFRRIASKAKVDPENNYVLVIDEINRGNIAKIFGELITLIEDDKREGEENALSISLPYSPTALSVPNNLYLLGTMNTADRSIALLDIALRRRFAFVEIMPEPTLLDGVIVESSEGDVDLGALLRTLNEKIVEALDRDHQIGHSYLLRVRDSSREERVEMLEYAWNHQLLPLLREYFYNQPEKLFEILSPMYPELGITKQDLLLGDQVYELEKLTGDDLSFALSTLVKTV